MLQGGQTSQDALKPLGSTLNLQGHRKAGERRQAGRMTSFHSEIQEQYGEIILDSNLFQYPDWALTLTQS